MPHNDDLCRAVTFRAAESPADGLTIDGYATVYDSPTRIDSWEGVFDEEFAQGAFARSIRARLPKLQFDHGMHPLIGSLPIGRWESVSEDPKGLHVIGRLHDNWLVEPVRQAIAEGSVDGMSIRFSVVREDWFDGDRKLKLDEVEPLLNRGSLRRVIREAKISEAGPVVWPAYQQTSVGVRSVTIDLGRLTDREQQKKLAQAVFLADAATRTDGPHVTDSEPDEHSPGNTTEVAVDPPVTTDSPDTHPSAEAQERKARLQKRAADYRGYLLTIRKD